MKIIVDAHGGDFGLKPNVQASVDAVNKLGVDIILAGREDEIRNEFKRLGLKHIPSKTTIQHCPEIIEMSKEPVEECKNKPNSSIMIGAELVADKKADAFISAGNSGAIMVASLLKIGRIKGISRPALAIPYPTEKGFSLVLDAGANMDSRPYHLLQFAIMGSVYMKNIFGISEPKVGILSIGEEETKGNSLVLETIPLLKSCNQIRFYGPVEGRDIPAHLVDVVVTDGFTGNVVLKLSEGLSRFILHSVKKGISKKIIYKIGAFLMKKIFDDLIKKTNPDELGAVPLLGINGIVLVGHGRTTSKAIFAAIKNAKNVVSQNLIEKIKFEIEKNIEVSKMTNLGGVAE
ncbi:MAG: phosphate acyltransferase PlsX [Elusimicrobiales bacterium]|nr:phosphate acyltransferase PlsX [Elusimicrobiales bacterium]